MPYLLFVNNLFGILRVGMGNGVIMSIVSQIKDLAQGRKMTIAELERAVGISNGQIRRWDTSKPSVDKLQIVADFFGVSTDYLLGRTDSKYYELSDKEKNDIAIQAEKLIDGLENGHNQNYYGEPATKEQRDRLLIAIRTAMEMNKEEAKKKFTRKDYRG